MNKKSSPTAGEDRGGVIENDFLMSEFPIPKLSQRQTLHQKVEAAGVEPASKQGIQKLSTRLFCD